MNRNNEIVKQISERTLFEFPSKSGKLRKFEILVFRAKGRGKIRKSNLYENFRKKQ